MASLNPSSPRPDTTPSSSARLLHPRALLHLAVAICVVRLLTLGTYPLMDTTEARYAEIARIMVETGDWLSPQFDYGVPFWGKPPLHTWITAAGIVLIGEGEFAVRAPHWVAGIATLWVVWTLSGLIGWPTGRRALATGILASTPLFIASAGAVMTDMVLCLSLTLAMAGFWLAWRGEKAWQWAFFFGLATGVLAKGPVAVAIALFAILPFLVLGGGEGVLSTIRDRFSWSLGCGLFLLITVPWFLLAERATPGFLEYFLLGEHWYRFTVPGWDGNLYGSAHAEPRGTVWLFWLVYSLPWSVVLLWQLFDRARARLLQPETTSWRRYLLLWAMAPLLLFTLAGNILPAYVLPGLPATAMLVAELTRRPLARRWAWGVAPWILILVVLPGIITQRLDYRSEKGLLERGESAGATIYYQGNPPFSARYYSKGEAVSLDEMRFRRPSFLAIPRETPLTADCDLRSLNRDRKLLFCPELSSDAADSNAPDQHQNDTNVEKLD